MRTLLRILATAVVSLGGVLSLDSCLAAVPAALSPGTLPDDVRLKPLKDLDGYFPFHPPATKAEWDQRSERVRERLRVALGLWPAPPKTPLNSVVHGKQDKGDYTIEKVYFESMPGFFVSGSLYRPKGKTGRLPAVLNPHGHWENGRFYDNQRGIKNEIAQGAERFLDSGRSPLQARCVQLARMGCVAFFYDMIGYADSQQISQVLAHGFSKQRPEMNSTENWGLFSPQAEAHLQSVMGLQSWSSIRALDFLLSLPDVDPNRVAVTGASGGGTQTFVLCALDPRPAVAFPAVMVSTAMQGGCTCENACLLRTDAGNVEIAGLFAPKPLGMTGADDWTKEMATKGVPQLRQLYQTLGVPDNVSFKPFNHFGHNYNHVSRTAMYAWVNRHLNLGFEEPVLERDYQRLSAEELTVWDGAHPKPVGGPDFERGLLRWWDQVSQEAIAATRADFQSYRATLAPALRTMIGRTLDGVGSVEWSQSSKVDRGDYLEMAGLLKNQTHSEALPVVWLYPKAWKSHTVLWLNARGKAGLWAASGELMPEVKKLLAQGATVIGVDLLFQGEFLADGISVQKNRKVKNPREAAAYSFGYNDTLFAQRAQDVLTVLEFVRTHEKKSERLDLIALDATGPIAVAARAVAGPVVTRLAVDTGGFRFGKVLDIHDANFLPGGAKYDDLVGMLAVAAPAATWISGETEQTLAIATKLYQMQGQAKGLTLHLEGAAQRSEQAVRWLLAQP